MDGRMISIPRHMKKIKTHDIAPAYLFFKCFNTGQLAALATILFIVIIITPVLLAPLFKSNQLGGIGKNDLKMRFFPDGLQVVVDVMMSLMSMPDYFRGMHT